MRIWIAIRTVIALAIACAILLRTSQGRAVYLFSQAVAAFQVNTTPVNVPPLVIADRPGRRLAIAHCDLVTLPAIPVVEPVAALHAPPQPGSGQFRRQLWGAAEHR